MLGKQGELLKHFFNHVGVTGLTFTSDLYVSNQWFYNFILFAVRIFLSTWEFLFCRENFDFSVRVFLFAVRIFIFLWEFFFAMRNFILLWKFLFHRENFYFVVRIFLSPWKFFFAVKVFLLLWELFFLKLVNHTKKPITYDIFIGTVYKQNYLRNTLT